MWDGQAPPFDLLFPAGWPTEEVSDPLLHQGLGPQTQVPGRPPVFAGSGSPVSSPKSPHWHSSPQGRIPPDSVPGLVQLDRQDLAATCALEGVVRSEPYRCLCFHLRYLPAPRFRRGTVFLGSWWQGADCRAAGFSSPGPPARHPRLPVARGAGGGRSGCTGIAGCSCSGRRCCCASSETAIPFG